jgi:hypothetical protein
LEEQVKLMKEQVEANQKMMQLQQANDYAKKLETTDRIYQMQSGVNYTTHVS